MVAIFSGSGTGFERNSASALSGNGLLGSASLGRSGEQVFVNAATGNLLISQRDEFLVGRGPDSAVMRTYNSLGDLSDENGDNWRQGTDRRVYGLTGTLNAAGSTVRRVSGDGSDILYTWDSAKAAYVSTDGSGAYDQLTSSAGVWTWTDGSTQLRETYAAYGAIWRISQQIDTDGNAITFTYTGANLTQLSTADGGTITYEWSGNRITRIVTSSQGAGAARTYYAYDASGRLSTVTVDLSPGDLSIANGATYTTTYTYHGTSRRVASIAQTDGSRIDIAYDTSNRVTTLAETISSGVTRTTSLAYGAGYTNVTDATGQVTRLDYAPAANFATHVDAWGASNVTKEAATIGGAAATKFTVQTTGWSAISQGVAVAAGDTVTFGVTMQAVGTVTSQSLGLYSDIDGWGAAGISSARIVSGPGQLVQTVGGLWTVTGLSTTQGTRIEVTRTYTVAQNAGAYLYFDHPGGYRAGTSLTLADISLMKSATATNVNLMNLANWTSAGVTRTAVGTIDGAAAYKYAVQTVGGWSAVYTGFSAAKGDSYSLSLSLQASDGYTSQSFGLYGDVTGWGSNAGSTARIVSGPGTLSQQGGLWTVSGLSATQVTRIEIIRNYEQDESAGAYIYADLPGSFRAGATLTIAAAHLTERIVEPATAQQLTKITAPPAQSGGAAQVVQFAYNAKGDLVSATDAAGNVTTYTYDAMGNMLTETDRLGNVVTRTYGSKNELLTETRYGSNAGSADAAHTTRYAYDAENHLRFVLGAEGNGIEYRYTATGQVEYQIEYPEIYYDVSALAPSTPVSEATLAAAVAGVADRNWIKITYNSYDARGQLLSTTRYGIATAGGAASTAEGYSRTNYVYSQAGQLLSRQNEGQNSETFLYDGLGRVVGSTDLNGGSTSIVFNDSATQTVITLANGFVKTSTYNKAGDLVSVTESGSYVAGGTATSKHDKLGRVRMTTDASGFNKYFVYDKLGRLVADVLHTGSLTEYRYDANNRVIATLHYMNLVSAANLAILADPNSTIEMAALRPAYHAGDIAAWKVYDKEGRVTAVMDNSGAVRTFQYDKSGRLVKTIAYANRLASSVYTAFKTTAPTAVVLPTADSARDSVARNFYDKEGRLLAVLDGEGYLSRAIYDRSGQKTEEIAYLNPTNAAYRASGTLNELISTQTAHVDDRRTRYVYDGQGFLRYEIDGLNQAVKFNYDVAGQLIGTTRYATALAATTDYTYDNVKAMLAASGQADALTSRRTWLVRDATGQVAYSIEGEGKVTGFTYDARGNVKKKVEYAVARPPINIIPTLAEMNSWASSQAANAANRTTRNFYSARDELRFSVDAEGFVSRTDFDAAGRVIREVRWDTAIAIGDSATIDTVNGAAVGTWTDTRYGYDFGGELTDVWDGENSQTHYVYSGTRKLATKSVVEASQSWTTYNYDGAGRVLEELVASGTTEVARTAFTYDGHGNVTSVTDANNNVTTRTYDKIGRMLSQTDPLGKTLSYEYNAFGEVVRTTDQRGYSSYAYYDRLGRVTVMRDAEDYVTQTAYDVFGNAVTVVRRYNRATNAASVGAFPVVPAHASDTTTSFQYDRLGRLTRATDAVGNYEQYTLDVFGNRTTLRNKLGGIITNSFDRLGRLVAETLPMSSTDALGNLVASSVTNRFQYDARGNLTKKIEADGLAEKRTTTYIYDKAGRLVETRGDPVAVMDQVGQAATTQVTPTEKIKYDARGRIIETIDALGARILYYYNKLDQKTAELSTGGTAGSGTLTTFTYDKMGNVLTSRVYGTAVALPATAGGTAPAAPGGEYRETSYTYDKLNRLTTSSVANLRTGAWNGASYATSVGTVTTTNEYDSSGNLIKTTDGAGGVSLFYYDKAGRRIASVDQDNYLTFLTLDGEGNVTQEERLALPVASPSTASNPATLRASVAGNAADRITQFTYDKNGRRLTETRLNVAANSVGTTGALSSGTYSSTVSYTYNGLGQVTQQTYSNGDAVNYSYDSTGRLLQESRAQFTDHAGAAVRPTTFYSYDGLNNLTVNRQGGLTAAATDRIIRYHYGAGGRLAWTRDATGAQFNYYYDAAGNMVRENWTRQKADGTSLIEAVLYTRDLRGRITSQGLATWTGSGWTRGDSQNTAYNSYGDVAQRGVNGLWQEQFAYDGAGRLYRSNSGDGVWRYYLYDGAGRQSLTLESEGTNLASLTLDQALAIATVNGAYALGGAYVDGINVTIGVFSKRGQSLQTRQPKRQLNATAAATDLVVSRTYNGFGEVASETDARGFTTDFTYNTMGRLIQKQSPAISYTSESGGVASGRPTEYYYYDVAGRMVAFRDANGNLMTRSLLAGTGHGGSEALVTREFHADGGSIQTAYDMFGDRRISWDEVGRRTDMAYDAMGRVTQITRPNGLIDYFGYDLLGQKVAHWNNVYQTPIYGPPEQIWVEDGYWDPYYGWVDTSHWETHTPIVGYAPEKEITDYDVQGRITRQVAFGGDSTTTSYVWNGSLATAGMGTFGGWTETTTMANGRTLVRQSDMFGRELSRTDLGGHTTSMTYDLAGRVVQRSGSEILALEYLNTGLAGRVHTTVYTDAMNWSSKGTTYGYDAAGNLISERMVDEGRSYSEYWDPYYGYQVYDYSWSNVYKNATASYDGMNRLVSWAEAGSGLMPAASIGYQYDLGGNIRRSYAQYRSLDANGNPSAYVNTQDNWYRYDAMNRVVTKGTLAGGQIVRGNGGVDYLYNQAGERIRATKTTTAWATIYDPYYYYDPYYGYGNPYLTVPYDADSREDYTYDAAGALATVRIAQSGYYDNGDGTLTVTPPPATGALRASYTHDLMGRMTRQIDWLGDGTNAAYDRTVTLNGKGQVVSEVVISRQGADTIRTTSSHDFGTGTGYALGAVTYTYSSTYKNNVYQNASTTTNNYAWYEGAVQSSIVYKPNTSQSTTYTTSFYYDGAGQLTSLYVSDGRPRSVSFVNDAGGQAIKRDESDNKYNLGDPHEIWYRFGGKQLGYTGNNGTLDTDYAQSISNRTLTPGTGAYRFGQSYGSAYANFDLSTEAITSYGQGSAAGSYTVRAGDTLQSIAAQLWGDPSLWYKLAEANGMAAANGLSEGQRLALPAGVLKSQHNAGTVRPYDPSETLGDVSPTTPQPTSKTSAKKNKCGVFGTILLVVIAVAVTVVTAGAAAAALSPAISGLAAGMSAVAAGTTGLSAGVLIGIGAASSALGSIASQAFGVATGIQDKFSWKGVAMAAIGGGVGAGLGATGAFSRIGNSFLRGAVSGATSSALTQGIGVATGLQDKFDWAGVAVAGVSGGVSAAVGDKLGNINKYAAQTISGGAAAIAGAAARSLITGTSFGDNLLAALPDVVGSTIGNMVADAVGSALTRPPEPAPPPAPEPAPLDPVTDELLIDAEATLYPQLASINGEMQLSPNEVQDAIRHLRPFVTPDEWDAANVAYRAAGGRNNLDEGMAAGLASMQASLTARGRDPALLAQIEIDWTFIRAEEGFETTGYVPRVGRSTVPDANSGVTIGTGFDLGMRDAAELRRMGIPQAMITRLTPYLGLQGANAQAALNRNALVLTEREANTLDAIMRGRKAESVATTYNNRSTVDFQDLASGYQTVIASVHFQHGSITATPNFMRQVTSQDWTGAIRNLRNWGSFQPRRDREAALMQRTLDASRPRQPQPQPQRPAQPQRPRRG